MLKLVQDIKKIKLSQKRHKGVFSRLCSSDLPLKSVFSLSAPSSQRPQTVWPFFSDCSCHGCVHIYSYFFFFFYSESAVKFTHYRGHGRLAFYLLILFDIFISQGLMHYTWRSYGPYKSSENGPGGDERRSELRTGSCSWDLTEAAS